PAIRPFLVAQRSTRAAGPSSNGSPVSSVGSTWTPTRMPGHGATCSRRCGHQQKRLRDLTINKITDGAIVRAMSLENLPRWLAWVTDLKQAHRAPFLARSPLFVGLPRRHLARLATHFLEKAYRPGEIVFQEGDPG